MKNEVINLIKALEEVEDRWRNLANEHMAQGQDAWAVYKAVSEQMSVNTKIRGLRNRYQHVLEGK